MSTHAHPKARRAYTFNQCWHLTCVCRDSAELQKWFLWWGLSSFYQNISPVDLPLQCCLGTNFITHSGWWEFNKLDLKSLPLQSWQGLYMTCCWETQDFGDGVISSKFWFHTSTRELLRRDTISSLFSPVDGVPQGQTPKRDSSLSPRCSIAWHTLELANTKNTENRQLPYNQIKAGRYMVSPLASSQLLVSFWRTDS